MVAPFARDGKRELHLRQRTRNIKARQQRSNKRTLQFIARNWA
jgi:hypothetical protein